MYGATVLTLRKPTPIKEFPYFHCVSLKTRCKIRESYFAVLIAVCFELFAQIFENNALSSVYIRLGHVQKVSNFPLLIARDSPQKDLSVAVG